MGIALCSLLSQHFELQCGVAAGRRVALVAALGSYAAQTRAAWLAVSATMVCRPVESHSCGSKAAQQGLDTCLTENPCCIHMLAVQQLCLRW